MAVEDFLALLLIATLSGCSSSEGTQSTRSHLEDCRGAAGDSAASATPDGGDPEPSDAERAAEAESECLSAGLGREDCDKTRFISRGEAICIARRLNAPQGTAPWRVTLVFAAVTKRVIWNVRIVTSPGVAKHYGIDAITGELARSSTSTSVE